ncbi:hypothetical protein HOG21_06670 [bacterium]|nr:hypothetical protein [bacterium]
METDVKDFNSISSHIFHCHHLDLSPLNINQSSHGVKLGILLIACSSLEISLLATSIFLGVILFTISHIHLIYQLRFLYKISSV